MFFSEYPNKTKYCSSNESLHYCVFFRMSPVIYCFVYYLWVGHNYCYAHLAGFTALFLLPGDTSTYTQISGRVEEISEMSVWSGVMCCCVFQVGVLSGSVTCGICQMDE